MPLRLDRYDCPPGRSLSDLRFFAAHAMALDIDGDGQTCNVRGGDLAGDAEGGRLSAEALRADAECIDFCEAIFFDCGDILARVVRTDVARQRLFGEECAGIESAADADPDIHGRAGLAPRKAHRLHDGIDDSLHSLGWGEHIQAGHVFAPEPLGQKGQPDRISRHDLRVQSGGRIVGGIDAREGIADTFAETKIFICAAHGIVYRIAQKFALDAHVLPDFGEDDGIARILADGHIFAYGGVGVAQNGIESERRGAPLFLAVLRLFQCRRAGGGEAQAGTAREFVDGFFDFVGVYRSHFEFPSAVRAKAYARPVFVR